MSETQWTTIIKAKSNIFNLNLKDILHYRDLIFLFVKRDFVAYYQQTLFGPFWYLIQPLSTMIVFTFIFGNVAKIPTDGLPKSIFYLTGITLWNYFSTCLTTNSNVFISNSNIFGKVYFPRLVVPISQIISNLIKFFIQFILFFGLFLYFLIKGSVIKPNIFLLITPLLLLQVTLLAFGCGVLISSLTTKYRDLGFLIGFGMQLWMYATPIVYPFSQIPEKWKWIFIVNPMAPIVEIFRYAFLGAGKIYYLSVIISVSITLIILLFGIITFNSVEKSFMDRV